MVRQTKRKQQNQVFVKSHYRLDKYGRPYKVRPYVKRKKPKGTKISYDKIGTFYVGHDDQGNFAGSRITPFKSAKKKEQPRKDRFAFLKQKYADGLISYDDYLKQKAKYEKIFKG